jgi:hypothetical protein
VLIPPGPKVAFTGGLDFNDHRAIWDRLDQVHAKHPDMVLLHGGAPRGAELIAAKWAAQRKVPQIAFQPDWTKHRKAAPFKRNDAMLAVMPIGVIVFPGTGIQANVAWKAAHSASRYGGSTAARKRRPAAPVRDEPHHAVRLVTVFASIARDVTLVGYVSWSIEQPAQRKSHAQMGLGSHTRVGHQFCLSRSAIRSPTTY